MNKEEMKDDIKDLLEDYWYLLMLREQGVRLYEEESKKFEDKWYRMAKKYSI